MNGTAPRSFRSGCLEISGKIALEMEYEEIIKMEIAKRMENMEQRRAEFNDNADHDLYFDFFQTGILKNNIFWICFVFDFGFYSHIVS